MQCEKKDFGRPPGPSALSDANSLGCEEYAANFTRHAASRNRYTDQELSCCTSNDLWTTYSLFSYKKIWYAGRSFNTGLYGSRFEKYLYELIRLVSREQLGFGHLSPLHGWPRLYRSCFPTKKIAPAMSFPFHLGPMWVCGGGALLCAKSETFLRLALTPMRLLSLIGSGVGGNIAPRGMIGPMMRKLGDFSGAMMGRNTNTRKPHGLSQPVGFLPNSIAGLR